MDRRPSAVAILPYTKGIKERLHGAYKKHNIGLYSKAEYTVRNDEVSPTHPLDSEEKCEIVYECGCGKLHIGKTERSFGPENGGAQHVS